MKPILFLLVGLVAGLVGLGFVMPAVAQWRHEGAMTGLSVALLLLGLVLMGGGLAAGASGIRRFKS